MRSANYVFKKLDFKIIFLSRERLVLYHAFLGSCVHSPMAAYLYLFSLLKSLVTDLYVLHDYYHPLFKITVHCVVFSGPSSCCHWQLQAHVSSSKVWRYQVSKKKPVHYTMVFFKPPDNWNQNLFSPLRWTLILHLDFSNYLSFKAIFICLWGWKVGTVQLNLCLR